METSNLMLLVDLKLEGPFTGLGFFTVDRTTLTAQLATTLTYFIILVQFNFCA